MSCERLPDATMDVDVRDVGDEAVASAQDRASYWERYRPTDPAPLESKSRTRINSYVNRDAGVRPESLPSNLPSMPVSIDVLNLPLRDVLREFYEIGGVNILPSDEVGGNVTVQLSAVPWAKALKSVLATRGYDIYPNPDTGILEVYPQAKIAEIEAAQLDRATKKSEIDRLKRGSSTTIVTEVFRLNYASTNEVTDQLKAFFASRAAEEGADNADATSPITILANDRTTSVVVRGEPADVEVAASVIKALDIRTPQILIEAIIVEANNDFDTKLGTRLGYSGERFQGTNPAAAAGQGLNFDDTGGTVVNLPVIGSAAFAGAAILSTNQIQIKMEIQAMAQEGLTKIISNPKIYALDNQPAEVFQGTEVPYESAAAEGGTSVSFKEAGLSMKVTPVVTGDGNIVMNVDIEKNTADFASAIGNNPPIDKRKISTTLVVKDGAVAAIGGIFSSTRVETETKVPLLGDIPLIGNTLFKTRGKEDEESELMVFLMPRII